MARDLREPIRSVIGVAILSSAWVLRQPGWIVQSIGLSIGFIVLMWGVGGSTGLSYSVIGLVVATMFSVGVNGVGQSIGWYKSIGVSDMILASPVGMRKYVFGMFISELMSAPSPLAPVVVVALATGQTWALVASVVASLPVLLIGVLLGLYIGLGLRSPTNISAITNPVSMLMSFLPPVFYPSTLLPPVAREALLVMPTAAAAELARSLTGMDHTLSPGASLLVLLGWTLSSLIVSMRVSRIER